MAGAAEPSAVRIVEVGPRDGLQNVAQNITAATKIELITRLRDAGLSTIEITSVVNRKVIPQLADREEVLAHDGIQALMAEPGIRAPVLVPNLMGLEIALQNNVKEVAVFVSASEAFSRANIRCSVDEGLQRAREVASKALSAGMTVRGYVSCIFECPFDGPTPQDVVLKCALAMLDMGCYEISLGDTTGVGVPPMVLSLINHLKSNDIPMSALAGHFHDTYGQAIANVWAAYMCGIRVFDSSVAGLGGCPYAPGAKGNLATEDLVYTMQQAGIDTGVDMASLVDTGVWISSQLSVLNASRAGSAMATRAQSPARDGLIENAAEYIPRSAPLQQERNEQKIPSGRMTPPEEASAKPDEHLQAEGPSPRKDSQFHVEEFAMERLPGTPESLSSGRSSPRRRQSRRLTTRALYKYIGPRLGADIPQRLHWRYYRRRRFGTS